MKHESQMWFRELKSHTEKWRAGKPLPDRNGLSRSQVLQLYIIKGSLLFLLKNLFAAISSLGDIKKSSPCIIFTSHDAGLAAASEIIQERKFSIIPLYPEELSSFLQLFPDTAHKHHVHIWSHFLEEQESQISMFGERFPLNDMGNYWLHVEGIMCGPQLGRGTEHLWSWDGKRPKLLKKNLHHWAS